MTVYSPARRSKRPIVSGGCRFQFSKRNKPSHDLETMAVWVEKSGVLVQKKDNTCIDRLYSFHAARKPSDGWGSEGKFAISASVESCRCVGVCHLRNATRRSFDS